MEGYDELGLALDAGVVPHSLFYCPELMGTQALADDLVDRVAAPGVRVVVADTGPLHYLVLIGQVEILPRLFGGVSVPAIVRDELDRAATPAAVRAWVASPPPWLAVLPTPPGPADTDPAALAALDEGERALEEIADWGPAEDWSDWADAPG